MGEVSPIREHVESASSDLTDVVGLAYRQASAQMIAITARL